MGHLCNISLNGAELKAVDEFKVQYLGVKFIVDGSRKAEV